MGAKRAKKPPPSDKVDPTEESALVIHRNEGESKETALARATAQPEINAAYTQLVYSNLWGDQGSGINELVSELSKQTKTVKEEKLGRGEEMLTAQAGSVLISRGPSRFSGT